jgi:hypothetical protein
MARRLGSVLILNTPDWLGPRPNFAFLDGKEPAVRRPFVLRAWSVGRRLGRAKAQTL